MGQHLKTPEGMEFTTTNGTNGGNKQGQNWGAGLGGFVGGGLVGYLIGQNWGGNGCGRNNRYNGCGDDAVVTRFELKQSEAMAAKDAEIARLNAERYADAIGISTFERGLAYVNRENDKQDAVTANLIQSSIDQQVNIKGLQSGLSSLTKSTTREIEVLAEAANKEFAAIERQFATERAISDSRYVAQPRVKICGTKYEFQCADPATVVASVAGTVKTVGA